MGNHGAYVAGVPIGKYCRSGRLMAERNTARGRSIVRMPVVAQSDNYYIAEGFGVEVQHYEDGTPTLKTPAVRELGDVARLRVPDPRRDGRMPVYLEAIGRLAEMTGGEVAVRAPGTGPFSLASHLLGTEQFLVEFALAGQGPGGLREQLETVAGTDHGRPDRLRHGLPGGGVNLVQAGDFSASLDMISPVMYRKWAWPAERRFSKRSTRWLSAAGPPRCCTFAAT